MDQKAAQIAELLAIAGEEIEEQDIAFLEKIALQVRDLLAATGLRTKTENQTTKEAIDGLFSPNNYYIFANMSVKPAAYIKTWMVNLLLKMRKVKLLASKHLRF